MITAPDRPTRASILRCVKLVFFAAPRLTSLLVFTTMAAAILSPGIAYTAMRLTEAIVARSPGPALSWTLCELLLAASVTLLGRLRTDSRWLLRGRVDLETRIQIDAKAAALDLAAFEDAASRDAMEAARGAGDGRPLELVSELLTLTQSVVSLTIYAFMLAHFNAWTLLLLLAALPGAAAELWSSRVENRGQFRRRRDQRRLRYFQDLLFSERHATENNFLEIGPPLLARTRGLSETVFREERASWRRTAPVVLLCHGVPPLILNGCYLFMALATIRGAMTLGTLMLFSMSLNSAQRLSQQLLLSGRSVLENWRHMDALVAYLDLPAGQGPNLPKVPSRPASPERGLCFEKVSFRYPGSEPWAIRHLDLKIRPGDFVAVIGGNGCGKTTLLKLMTGLCRPTEGRITLDGVDLGDLDPSETKRRFAVVFQDFARYGLTVRENVSIGLPMGATDMRAPAPLGEALHASGATEMVARLPGGLDTELISGLGQGVGLSGGEWQKVALARALAREWADFVVLDEPTAALDIESERRVFAHLRNVHPTKTIILITHRLSTLHDTDQVVVLERGRRVQVGAN
jgi:ATP-binding cassette, subfamily B, bacterial